MLVVWILFQRNARNICLVYAIFYSIFSHGHECMRIFASFYIYRISGAPVDVESRLHRYDDF